MKRISIYFALLCLIGMTVSLSSCQKAQERREIEDALTQNDWRGTQQLDAQGNDATQPGWTQRVWTFEVGGNFMDNFGVNGTWSIDVSSNSLNLAIPTALTGEYDVLNYENGDLRLKNVSDNTQLHFAAE